MEAAAEDSSLEGAMLMTGIENLLQQQRQVVVDAKHKRQQRAAATLPQAPAEAAAAEELPPKRPRTAGEVLLRALAGGQQDVAAYLQEQGVSFDGPQPPELAVAGVQMLTATLLKCGPPEQRGPAATGMQQPQEEQQQQEVEVAGREELLARAATLLQWLRAAGADLNRTGPAGVTPLLAAVHAGTADIVRGLLAAGARPDLEAEPLESPAYSLGGTQQGAAFTVEGQDAASAGAAAAGTPGGTEAVGTSEAGSVEPQQQPQQQAQQAQQQQGKRDRKRAAAGRQPGSSQQAGTNPPPAPPAQPTPLVLACRRGQREIAELLLVPVADANRASVTELAPGTVAAAVAEVASTAAAAGGQQAPGGRQFGAENAGPGASAAGAAKKCSGAQDSRAGEPGTGSSRAAVTTPLMAAVCSQNEEVVELLLQRGADVHCRPYKESHQSSALWLAVDLGLEGITARLVEAGACRGSKGRWISAGHPALSALALAAARGHVALVDLLYPRVSEALQGGDRTMVGQLGRHESRHPLAAAAERGQEAAVARLLELGASPNNSGSRKLGHPGYTPLMLAAANGHLAVAQQLLTAGARVGIANERRECAASLALQGGHLELTRRLLEASRDEAEREAQLSMMASQFHCGFAPGMAPVPKGAEPPPLEQVERERAAYRRLLPALVEQQEGCVAGVPPSVVARAAAGSAALLDALLACGASVSGQQQQQQPSNGAAAGAMEQGAPREVQSWLVLENGRSSLPLLHAAWFGWEAVQRLLERGADVNERSTEGTSLLLTVASRAGLAAVGEQLLRWPGLDLRQADRQGRDAVGLAIRVKNARFGVALLARLLEGRCSEAQAPAAAASAFEALSKATTIKALADINAPDPGTGDTLLLRQVRTAAPKAISQLLLVPDLDINAVNPRNGCTPLMAAVERRQVSTVQALLGTGRADVNARDARGTTALLQAARRQDAVAMRLLLAAGADPNLGDNHGDTPLMALARGGQHKLIMELCKDHSAALDARDADSMTALMFAADCGRFNAAKVLRNLGADALARSGGGQTARELALAGGHAEVAVLLKAGPGEAAAGGETAPGPEGGGAEGAGVD